MHVALEPHQAFLIQDESARLARHGAERSRWSTAPAFPELSLPKVDDARPGESKDVSKLMRESSHGTPRRDDVHTTRGRDDEGIAVEIEARAVGRDVETQDRAWTRRLLRFRLGTRLRADSWRGV